MHISQPSVSIPVDPNWQADDASAWASEVRLLVRGVVVRGDQRGRTIGFPTANLALGDGDAPTDGVYAGYAHLPTGEVIPAAVSVGRRSTFYGDHGVRLLEAHLLRFDGDLYGQRMLTELVSRLRGQVAFEGIDALRAQLASDVVRCDEVLTARPPSRTAW